MNKLKFGKGKIENAIKAVEEMCLHCEKHEDDCPIVKCCKLLGKCK